MAFFPRSLTLLECVFSVVLICYYLYRRFTRNKVFDRVPGPPSSSFLYGNVPELLQAEAGKYEFKWCSEYGPVVRLTGPLGQPVLLIADPKTIHHIYQTGGYHYPRPRVRSIFGRIFSGIGITTVDGDHHRRLRKVMQPGFGAPESRALLPIFISCAQQLANKWKELLSSSPSGSVVLDLPSWASRATLDAIGLAAFDYHFGALDNAENVLSKAYQNFFHDTFGQPSSGNILFMTILNYFPSSWVSWLFNHTKAARIERAKSLFQQTRSVAKMLVEEKSNSVVTGAGYSKDVMSLIVRANASENADSKLTDEEMYALMQVVLLAGHETTANSLGWTSLELSNQPDVQRKLREEIQATEQKIRARGGTEVTPQDFDAMPYLNSVVKEVLRQHPAAPLIQRVAGMEDILPLSQPLVLTNGETITELPIPKGTLLFTSIAAYNRSVEVFGEDAHSFNPDRWQHAEDIKKKGTYIGVYSNLFTFSGGKRSCIGWRFAVLELQAFMFTLFGNFEIHLAIPAEKVRRESATVMIPTIEGEPEKGSQLPISIKLADRDE